MRGYLAALAWLLPAVALAQPLSPPGSGGSGSGNVTGPASSTASHCTKFADTTGKLLADAGAPCNNAPTRTASSPTVATTDMLGTIWATGTITIPAISAGLFDAGQTLLVVNVSGSTETVTSTPTINTGAGCVQAAGIPAGYGWQLQPDASTPTTLDCFQIASPSNLSTTIASGTSALGTGAITSATCATVVTTSATGIATTDVIWWGFNGDPTGVTGYTPVTTGALTIFAYPSANNVNFKVCNLTTASITPGAITLNWRVIR